MTMKIETVKFVGAGFHCIDIIRINELTKLSLGGTAANVISILAGMEQETYFLCVDYQNEWGAWLKQELYNKGVNAVFFSQSKTFAPRIIESLDAQNGYHSFLGICPVCGRKIINTILPDAKHISKPILSQVEGKNVFFFDRVSAGIKAIISQCENAWICYEPNTCRNYKAFLDVAKKTNIIKFSADRIPMVYNKKMLKDLQESRVCLLISTMGAEGFCYSYRKENGNLSEWIYIDSAKTDSVYDTTGAGDWFTAVFLKQLTEDYPFHVMCLDPDFLKKALNISKEIASLKCQYLGVYGMLSDPKANEKISRMLNVSFRFYQEKPLIWGNGCYMCGL